MYTPDKSRQCGPCGIGWPFVSAAINRIGNKCPRCLSDLETSKDEPDVDNAYAMKIVATYEAWRKFEQQLDNPAPLSGPIAELADVYKRSVAGVLVDG